MTTHFVSTGSCGRESTELVDDVVARPDRGRANERFLTTESLQKTLQKTGVLNGGCCVGRNESHHCGLVGENRCRRQIQCERQVAKKCEKLSQSGVVDGDGVGGTPLFPLTPLVFYESSRLRTP